MADFADHFMKMILITIMELHIIDVNANTLIVEMSIMILDLMLTLMMGRCMKLAVQANDPGTVMKELRGKIVIMHRTTTCRVTRV